MAEKDVLVSEAQELKADLETKILNLITKFSKDTKVGIVKISVKSVDAETVDGQEPLFELPIYTGVEVTAEL